MYFPIAGAAGAQGGPPDAARSIDSAKTIFPPDFFNNPQRGESHGRSQTTPQIPSKRNRRRR